MPDINPQSQVSPVSQNNASAAASAPIVIYPSKPKLILLLLGSVAMIYLGYFIMTAGDELFIGAMTLFFFGLCLIYCLYRLIFNKPLFTIASAGITDNSNLISVGFIPWDEVEKVNMQSMANNNYIAIFIKNPVAKMQSLNFFKKFILGINMKRLDSGYINIPANVLPMPGEELIRIMQNYMMSNQTTNNQVSFVPRVEPLKKWNWGAFILTFIWGISNGVWISLLVFVPVIGQFMPFYLGLKGNELAWKAKKWNSMEEFQRVQHNWAVAGLILVLIVVVFMLMALFAVFMLRANQ